ncbi:MAG: roadblock/LC7 domain-containing protein [Candidatus Thermoplasmatota archaeon]|nr:roadblock/LC7 domain-containing protein [Candidatus Thermoplasmatota archaeon]
MEKIDKLQRELKKLATIEGIVGSAIIARNGLIIAEELPEGVDERRVGAMAATLVASIETLASTIGKGVPKRVEAELERSSIIVSRLGHRALLLAILAPNANLELINSKLELTIKELNELMLRGAK